MFPVLFHLGDIPVQAYGFFVALGYLAALLLTRKLAVAKGLSAAHFSDLCFLSLLVGLVGARLLFVLTNFSFFLERPLEIFRFWSGGLVFYGGFLLVVPTLALSFHLKKIPWKTGLDILAPGLALGHAIGRLGCLAAGCCHGSYCELPWALRLDSEFVDPVLRGSPLHPVQAYEFLGLLVLCGILLRLTKKNLNPGSVALAYVLGYGLLRIAMEFFRGDSIRGAAAGLSTSQLISIPLVIISAGLLAGGFRGLGRKLR